MPRLSLPGFCSALERRLFALLVGGIVCAAVIILLVPLPSNVFLSAALVGAISFADAFIVAAAVQRQLHQYEATLCARAERAEQQVRESERLASAGRVAAGIAHEIGNPLTGIANFAHVLRGRAGASPEAEAALGGIEREVERIDRIVSTLLDYARPKQADPAPFDAGGTLRAAVQLLAAQGVFRQVEINVAIEEQPIALVGNPHELEQAFVNLLLNAIDAMSSQGTLSLYAGRVSPSAMTRTPRRVLDTHTTVFERAVNPRLDQWRARVADDQPCAKFIVADSGTGVATDDADRVFNPFFTTKQAGDGSGLGLAIVQRVVDAHNGVVWVQRAREGGAAFHVVLPLGAFGQAPARVS